MCRCPISDIKIILGWFHISLLQTSIFLVEPNQQDIVSESSTVKVLKATIYCLGHLVQVVLCKHETTPSLTDFTTPSGLLLMLNYQNK